jgi:protein involved in polysaccharide export with SLBB domain
VNFVKSRVIVSCIYRNHIVFYPVLALYLLLYLNGCSDKVILPSIEQLVEFESTSPPSPVVDFDRLARAKIGGGSYRVVTGEVLEITMPAILRVVTTDESVGPEKDAVYICRINETGNITLPVVGQIPAAGKTLAQIESAIIDAYYPEYALTLPSVFAKVLEYETAKVSISGAVQNPGIYSLRSDQMSLVALLMEAGGIIDQGAAVIRIVRSENKTDSEGREIPKKPDERNTEQITRPVNAELTESSSAYLNSNDTNVLLDFKRLSMHGTTGIITIIRDKKVLLTEQMDITSEIERLVLLKQLSWREPRVSTAEVERKLCALAESLRPGSGSSIIESSIVNEYVVSLTNIDEGRGIREKNSIPGSKVFPAFGNQRSGASPELYKPSYGVHYDTAGENGYSNVGFNTADPKRSTITYVAINEELNEILDMVTNQKVGKKDSNFGYEEPESIVLPVKGFNIPFADVVLKDGDNVIVERLAQPLFSVIGLVSKPGNFPYPPNVQYNLMQALAFAGGLDPTAEPRYATVYRLKPDGSIVHVTFEVVKVGNSSHLTDALNIHIKPGDIVSVEHTPRTRTNVFLDRIFRINLGTYFSLNDVWND